MNKHRGSDMGRRILAGTALQSRPAQRTQWSVRAMEEHTGVSKSTVQRWFELFGVQPHRQRTFRLSNDPFFVEKVRDIVGLYLDPPDKAVVLCVDEKTQIQALERHQPMLPMGLGYAQGVSHGYVRHGTTTLFAAPPTPRLPGLPAPHRPERARGPRHPSGRRQLRDPQVRQGEGVAGHSVIPCHASGIVPSGGCRSVRARSGAAHDRHAILWRGWRSAAARRTRMNPVSARPGHSVRCDRLLVRLQLRLVDLTDGVQPPAD